MDTLIKNGKIVRSDKTFLADILISGERIIKIEENIECEDCKVIDAKGCYVFPGFIDTHTHFDLDTGFTKTSDDFNTGTKAAIMGGTTTILDFATQDRGSTLKKAFDVWTKKAEDNSFCDYGFHMAITEYNDYIEKEMEEIVEMGMPSFKLYMAYDALRVDDGCIYRALRRSKDIGAIIGFHCENGDIINALTKESRERGEKTTYYHPRVKPAEIEGEATERVIAIADMVKSPLYIVHVTCREALEKIERAKDKGIKVFGETCPQYLLLDISRYGDIDDKSFEGGKYVLSPPLRDKKNQDILWEGIKNNIIDFIGTDHCSFNFKGQKDIGIDDYSKIPNGIPGVEHRFYLMYTEGVMKNKITLNKMVEILSSNGAKFFGMYPDKGEILEGSIADIVIYDPDENWTISYKNQYQNVDYTPYEGFNVSGKIKHVFLRGNHVVEDGNMIIEKPLGKFVKGKRFDYDRK
ncbi:MAG: dihydropyrimidinase [Oscillospiraceae bacterium]|nr:dihydropyrimidinase [Oscillospiraceae bacterium]